jgi:ABC-type glycerol-3-phosphate transport system substrate-binding protein
MRNFKMTKLLMNVLVLASVVGVAACSSTGGANTDETLTQAPYAEERTVGNAPAQETVQSAEPVFESKQVK